MPQLACQENHHEKNEREPRLPCRALACRAARRLGGEDAKPRPKSREAKLIAVLKSSTSEKEKADACLELARIGTKESVAPLAALLGDEKLGAHGPLCPGADPRPGR